MQAIRTGFWVLLAVALTIFAAMNFHGVQVHVWPASSGYDYLEWPLALVIVASFLIGFLPMFLAYRTAKWTGERKIRQQDETIALLRPAPGTASHSPAYDTAPATPAPTPLAPDPLP